MSTLALSFPPLKYGKANKSDPNPTKKEENVIHLGMFPLPP